MAERSILVTGGAGYIGSHCCKALSEAGYNPICFDNFSSGHRAFVKWGPLIEGDLHNSGLVIDTLKANNVSAVMHFAAFSAVGESVADPQKYYVNNVAGTLSLLRSMRETGCQNLVFSSTGAVYGDAAETLISETAPKAPVNPYGSSKLMIETILADYRRAYGLNSVCLRYFNASGADFSGVIGELRDPETHLIPRALMALQGHVADFSIFGDDYPTPDGTPIRDYIHVVDLARAHLLALQLLSSGHQGGIYNLGTGTGFSVREILRAITAETGRTVPALVRPRRPGDPSVLVADPGAAKEILRFYPLHSDISTIIKTAWAWHMKAHPLRDKVAADGPVTKGL
jgi:UDP-glucose-4-epimerase GalE